MVVLSAILGRTPTIEEYEKAVQGIELTEFAPPEKEMATAGSSDYLSLRISASGDAS